MATSRLRSFIGAFALGCASLTAVLLPATVRAQDTQSIYDGVYTEDQYLAGRAVYAKNCVSCHGNRARGGPGGPGIVGRVMNDKYLDAPLSAYFDYMRSTMPKGAQGSLTGQDYADILAFVLNMHGAPAGEQELTDDPALLDAITITEKPDA